MLKSRKIYILLIVLIIFIVVVISYKNLTGYVPAPGSDIWKDIRNEDVAVTSNEWENPTLLPFNSIYWEDSPFVSGDGSRVLFVSYPGDLLNHASTGEFVDDIDVMKSSGPQFKSKSLDTRYYLSEDVWSTGSVIETSSGDLFYDTNRDWINDQNSDNDIWRNDVRLPFNTDLEESNPFYCESSDELYFDRDHKDIYVLKNAAVDGWTGTPVMLDNVVNQFSAFHTWLTPDCQTMYFASNRGDVPSGTIGSAIYKTTKNGNSWTNPELIIYSNNNVGKPSLTDDGNKLFFVQVFKDDSDILPGAVFNADIMVVNKVGTSGSRNPGKGKSK
jgi:hypothetical protein